MLSQLTDQMILVYITFAIFVLSKLVFGVIFEIEKLVLLTIKLPLQLRALFLEVLDCKQAVILIAPSLFELLSKLRFNLVRLLWAH